jgi:hypothetical protein
MYIDFNVPARTPRLSSTENSLQLPENITLSHILLYRCHQQRDLGRHQVFGGLSLCMGACGSVVG